MHGLFRLMVLPLLVLLAVSVGSSATPTQAANSEFRAYWVDAWGPGIFSSQQIDKLVADVKAANMNAIVVQVGRRGDCFCNKAIMPRTQAPIDPLPFDPLQTLIDKAHAQGIQVHAWIVATAIWSSTTPPVAPNHVFNTHGPSKAGYDNWINLRSDGRNSTGGDFYLDPGHPDAAAYIVSMATSIVANYDVDGINLDRIRYPDDNLAVNVPSWGYNSAAVARFRAATGRGDVPASTDPQWMQWRRDQVTDIVRRVYLESYALKPSVRVSADTIPYGYGPQTQGGWENTHTYLQVLQDWRGWMQEGILDLNIPMNYKNEDLTTEPDNNQRRMYVEWNEFIKDNQFGRQAAIGAGISMNTVDDTIVQVRKAQAQSAAGNRTVGWVGYSYRTPDRLALNGTRSGDASRIELTKALTQPSEYDTVTPPVFSSPATVPTMPWKAQPTTGHIKGTLKAADGTPLDRVRVEVYDAATKGFAAARETDASGWFGFVDLKPGRYDLLLAGARGGSPIATVDVTAGGIATADLSLCSGSAPAGVFCVEYYPNTELGAPAVYATVEPTIDHVWAGPPAPRVGADHFSARWTGSFSFDAADYTFLATADDGFRVWVDDALVIDGWKEQAPTTYEGTVRLSAGSHRVRMDYYQHLGGAVAKLAWNPYRAQYYNNPTLSGNPIVTRYEAAPISYNWGSGGPVSGVPSDNFSVRWVGTFGFDAANYTFTTTADDGVRLWIDDDPTPLIDKWFDQGPTRYQAAKWLSAGYHKFRLEYYERSGGASIQLSWSACYLLILGHTGNGSDPSASPTKSAACATAGRYVAGEQIALSASPLPGEQILGWTGTNDDASTSTSNTATMPAAARTVSVAYTQGTATPQVNLLPQPVRVVDTRPTSKLQGSGQPLNGYSSYRRYHLAGSGGVPSYATAVLVNLTAVGYPADGWLSAYPACTPRPATSNVNFDTVENAIANFAIVKLGVASAGTGCQGSIDVTGASGTNVVVDVVGYLLPIADSPVVLLDSPQRIVDTRSGLPLNGYELSRRYSLAGQKGIPADAAAVLVNLTAVGHTADGWLAAWPACADRPAASSLNFDTDENSIANFAIVRLGEASADLTCQGAIDVTGATGTNVIVDAVGYLVSTPPSEQVALLSTPQRLVDTRFGYGGPLQGGTPRCYLVAGQGGVPLDATGAIVNVTAVGYTQDGWIAAYPSDRSFAGTSTVNFDTQENAIANTAVVRLGTDGKVCLIASAPTNAIVDVSGYLVGP